MILEPYQSVDMRIDQRSNWNLINQLFNRVKLRLLAVVVGGSSDLATLEEG